MVIQRWQSVLLLIAAACMVAVCFIPFAHAADGMIPPSDITVFFVLNLTSAVTLARAIFLYRNMPRQKMVTLLSIVLILISAGTGVTSAYLNYSDVGLEVAGCALMGVALIASIWAYRRIAADQRLLRAADRLR